MSGMGPSRAVATIQGSAFWPWRFANRWAAITDTIVTTAKARETGKGMAILLAARPYLVALAASIPWDVHTVPVTMCRDVLL